jgi:hypothetical protein
VTHGPHYRSSLSSSTLFRIVDVLICTEFFDNQTQDNDMALELHLRCIIAALRIIKINGFYSSNLTFDFLDKVHNSMSKWVKYEHWSQSQDACRSNSKPLANCNNEFLTIYAIDLISAVSTDRDLTTQAVTRVAAGVALMARLVQVIVSRV